MENEPFLEVNGKLLELTNMFNRKPLRKSYMARFVVRCIVYLASLIVYIRWPSQLFVVVSRKWSDFFTCFSFAHVVWIIWIIDMVLQLIPLQKHIPIGSQKNFKIHFRPVIETVESSLRKERIINHIKSLTIAAYKVFILWAALIVVIGLLYVYGPIEGGHLFLFAVTFYVCDLICVLFWCPFRVFIMKNKCCTTCRIFNWDHLMMFSPFLFLPSFFAVSLYVLAIVIWAIWELTVLVFPERFSLMSNRTLKCSECTDRLCRKPRGDKAEAGYRK